MKRLFMKRLTVALLAVLVMGLGAATANAELVAHYKFENNMADSTGNYPEGTISGGTAAYVEGPAGFGQAMDFFGDTRRVLLGTWSPGGDTGTFSFAMWIKAPADGAGVPLAKRNDFNATGMMWHLRINDGTVTTMELKNGFDSAADLQGIPFPARGEWFHVAGTFENCGLGAGGQAGVGKIYVNGAIAKEGTVKLGALTTANLVVGAGTNTGTASFAGQLDDLRFYDRVLSVLEIQALMANSPVATNPTPANNAVGVEINPVLSWDAPNPALLIDPDGAVEYMVYFDRNKSLVNAGDTAVGFGPLDETEWSPANRLSPNTVYYWRVDVIAQDFVGTPVVYPGQAWSFTTVMPECEYPLPGDLDGNCIVDIADLALMAENWKVSNLADNTVQRQEANFIRSWLDPMNALDSARWRGRQGSWTWVERGGEGHWNAVSFEDGVVRLGVVPKKEGDPGYPGHPNSDYWLGGIATHDFSQRQYNEDAIRQTHKYGRFETLWKASAADTAWGTFFTIHHEYFPGTNTRRDWSEFDFEFMGQWVIENNYLTVNLHYTDIDDASVTHRETGALLNLGFDARADFHTYAIEWTPDSLAWYVDEKLMHKLTRDDCHGIRYLTYPQSVHLTHWLRRAPTNPDVHPSYNEYDHVAYYSLHQTLIHAADFASAVGAAKKEHREGGLFYRYLGDIDEGDTVMYPSVAIKAYNRVTFELLASALPGRRIQVRTGSATGPIIAEVPVPNTGDGKKFETVTANITGPTATGTQNVYLTFTGGSNIANIREIRFWGNTPRPTGQIEPGLVAYYKFDETHPPTLVSSGNRRLSHTTDHSGNGNGTLFVGGMKSVPGKFGNAMEAGDSHMEAGFLDPSGDTEQMTLSFWANWKGVNGKQQGLVSKRDAWGNDDMRWQIGMGTSGTRAEFGSAEGGAVGADLPTNTWVHIAVTYDQGTARFYLDGNMMQEATDVQLGNARRARLRIGALQTNDDRFNGAIDEVRFYDRVLSSDEIAALAE